MIEPESQNKKNEPENEPMNKYVEFRLNPECVKFFLFDLYEKDFTFIGNGKRY